MKNIQQQNILALHLIERQYKRFISIILEIEKLAYFNTNNPLFIPSVKLYQLLTSLLTQSALKITNLKYCPLQVTFQITGHQCFEEKKKTRVSRSSNILTLIYTKPINICINKNTNKQVHKLCIQIFERRSCNISLPVPQQPVISFSVYSVHTAYQVSCVNSQSTRPHLWILILLYSWPCSAASILLLLRSGMQEVMCSPARIGYTPQCCYCATATKGSFKQGDIFREHTEIQKKDSLISLEKKYT